MDYRILMRKVAAKTKIVLYESYYDEKVIMFDILEVLDKMDSETVPALFRTKLYDLYVWFYWLFKCGIMIICFTVTS